MIFIFPSMFWSPLAPIYSWKASFGIRVPSIHSTWILQSCWHFLISSVKYRIPRFFQTSVLWCLVMRFSEMIKKYLGYFKSTRIFIIFIMSVSGDCLRGWRRIDKESTIIPILNRNNPISYTDSYLSKIHSKIILHLRQAF